MKKTLFLTVLLLLAMSSFAQDDIPNRYIFIDGTAESREHLDFFLRNFQMEADAAGYTVTSSKAEAAHTVLFNVGPNTISDSDEKDQQDENKYVIKISLVSNADDFEILNFDFFFTDLEEMYVHNRNLFQTATLYIPPFTEDDMIVIEPLDNRWKNKWIYFRLSFDYPISFYLLKGDGLVGLESDKGLAKIGLYEGSYDHPDRTTPITHLIYALPGLTAGLEFHFLNFVSLELNFQVSMGLPENPLAIDIRSINMAAGAELKFPIKFKNTMLIPYGAFTYPLQKSFKYPLSDSYPFSDVFESFPKYAIGGGVQFCARGGKHGAFFVDVKYMLSFGPDSDTIMKNPFSAENLKENQRLAPNPPVIHYKRSVIGIGIGYKIGFFDKKEKKR